MEPRLQWVDPNQLRPNSWNPNVMDPEMYQKAVASIRAFGFVDPITARSDASEFFEIIDGENRWKAALDEELIRIPVFDLGVIDDQTAQKLTIVLNETRGSPDAKKLGDLLRSLSAKETKEQLLATLPFSSQAFDGLTGLPTLRWEDRPALRAPEGKPARWVERIYRMPVEAAEIVDHALARAREDDPGMTDWQALEAIAADFLS